ncbi:hypothetical protein VNO77_04043 [Canavalia gladiata]|uniref:Uncharacterized protein n=1 Tax=Canavalia gladiata TaxID=3824 RepID=A0AAN9MWI9_CANGL
MTYLIHSIHNASHDACHLPQGDTQAASRRDEGIILSSMKGPNQTPKAFLLSHAPRHYLRPILDGAYSSKEDGAPKHLKIYTYFTSLPFPLRSPLYSANPPFDVASTWYQSSRNGC